MLTLQSLERAAARFEYNTAFPGSSLIALVYVAAACGMERGPRTQRQGNKEEKTHRSFAAHHAPSAIPHS